MDVEEEHRRKAEEQAASPEDLHGADQLEAAVEVVQLCQAGGLGLRVTLVLLLEATHDAGVGEEAVGIGQQDQRDGREEEGGRGEVDLIHILWGV